MDKPAASRLDINSTRKQEFTAPTPQNTPINPAPITSNYRPSVSSISEDAEKSDGAAESSNLTGAFTSNPALISMLQGKLGNLAGRASNHVDSLPASVKRRLHGLQHIQSQHAELEGHFQEEVLALEKKYLALYTPLYERRTAIITGKAEPTDQEVALGEAVDQEENEEPKESVKGKSEQQQEQEQQEQQPPTKGIPEFWLTALKNHPHIAETITEADEMALKHLTDIRMSYMDKPGFKLHFEFEENDHFSDKTLTKTYYYQEHAYGGDYVYDHADGCTIHWKEGKNLTTKVETKKQRHKGTNKTRVVKRSVPADSFFSFFNPPTFPDDNEELDKDEAEGLDHKLEIDYETGEEFKDKIIPRAIDYFTGKALEYEELDSEDGFEEDSYGEDDEEDDDESEDDDDDDDVDDKKSSKGENAPECKQS